VTSVDASFAAVEFLRARVSGPVAEADVTDLPFADGTFDAAVLGEVLEHVEHDRLALTEVARVLRPEGLLALSVPAGPTRFGPSDHWAGHVRRYSRQSLVETCEAAGFRILRCSAWGFPFAGLYHRHFYERRLDRHGAAAPRAWERPALAFLRVLLQIDRLFVGVERGALGYLLLASRD
jgi:SAM-dependent methyltransferase